MIQYDFTKYNLLALFVLAFILGAGLKAVAAETITIGFDDYKLAPKETLYDLNGMQRKFMRAR